MPIRRRTVILSAAAAVSPFAAQWARSSQVVAPPRPPRPPIPPFPPPPFRPLEPIALESIQVSTDVKAGVASSKVELLLRNPSDQPREGDLLLPIPEGAAVRDFAAYDGERRLESEILDKDNARRLYEEIVRQRRDPALLEFEGLEAVRMRVFPIDPRSTRKLTLRLTHALPRVGASWRLEFRFRGPHLPEAERVRWDISLSQIPHVYSPTHAVEVQQREGGRTTVRFDAKVGDTALAEAPSVVVLATAAKDEALALALSTYRVGDGDGTFALVASPGRPAPARSQASPRKWVLVMDRSGSMSGRKIEQARGALLAALEQLRPVDQFQLISFSDKAERAFDAPKPASTANVTTARRWVDDLTADGGTNIDAALRSGLESFDRDHKAAVLFFTDGRPTVGQRDTRTLVAEAVKRAGSRTRVFVFGVGYDVDVPFLDQLAGRLRGDADYVRPDEDIEVKTARFLARSGDPLLANPVLRMEGVSVRDMTPSLEQLPDLYEGVPWLVAGRYRGPVPKGRLILEGEAPDGPKRFVLEAAFPERSSESDWVPQLWAARRIGELLDQIRLSDPDDPRTKELIESVVSLSKTYGILTPYTAGYVPEPGQPRPSFRLDVSAKALQGASPSGEGAVNRSQALRAQRNQAQVGNRFAAGAVAGAEREQADRQLNSVKVVAGRVFFQNGSQWAESGTETTESTNVVKIKSFSPLWFALASRNRSWARWMAQGAEVQVRGASGKVVQFGDTGLEKVDDRLLKELAP